MSADRLERIEAKLDRLIGEVVDLRADVRVLNSDVADTKADVGVLKSDVANLTGEVAGLKSNVADPLVVFARQWRPS